MLKFSKFLIIALAVTQALFGEPVSFSSQPTIIYLTRHGETDSNLNRILHGSTDVPLNATGIEQAKAVKKELEGVVFNAGYSSDLNRAIHTAGIVLEGRNLKVTIEPRLREKGFGCFEGVSMNDYEPLSKEEKDKHTEPTDAVATRAMAALEEIATAHQGETVFVASHGALIKIILAPIMDVPRAALSIDNLAIAKLTYKDGKWIVADTQRIKILNAVLH